MMNTDTQIEKLVGLSVVLLTGIAALACLRLMREFDADQDSPRIREATERLAGGMADAIGLSPRPDAHEAARGDVGGNGEAERIDRRWERAVSFDQTEHGEVGGDEASVLTDSEFAPVPGRVPPRLMVLWDLYERREA
jgi:hypothetical protein